MPETMYKIICKNQIIARDMRLDDAMIFVKALFATYWKEAKSGGFVLAIAAYSNNQDDNDHTLEEWTKGEYPKYD